MKTNTVNDNNNDTLFLYGINIKVATNETSDILDSYAIKNDRKKICLWVLIIIFFVLDFLMLIKMISNGGKLYHNPN